MPIGNPDTELTISMCTIDCYLLPSTLLKKRESESQTRVFYPVHHGYESHSYDHGYGGGMDGGMGGMGGGMGGMM
ncbi:hypothetical protein BLOT_009275 [Blomia tropicalis]|nr:hypothetical protein BLOT_009275 [Blomia tropicalis]